jgi:hypothetical protein
VRVVVCAGCPRPESMSFFSGRKSSLPPRCPNSHFKSPGATSPRTGQRPSQGRCFPSMPGSVVTVQLGQCGNQVRCNPALAPQSFPPRFPMSGVNRCGHPPVLRIRCESNTPLHSYPSVLHQVGTELFSTLAREADACSGSTRDEILDAFFRTPNARRDRAGSSKFPDDFPEASTPTARAVLIDMEPKVVQSSVRIAKKSGRWRFDTTRTLAFQAGSGNNWARGYNTYGGQVRETACELIRKEVEQCDFFGGFLLLQSMAGGTGAGLGAYVAQALRDEHPHAPLLNHCVWPYESGEVIVQSYNTLLTASALLDCSGARCAFPKSGGTTFLPPRSCRPPRSSKGSYYTRHIRTVLPLTRL